MRFGQDAVRTAKMGAFKISLEVSYEHSEPFQDASTLVKQRLPCRRWQIVVSSC